MESTPQFSSAHMAPPTMKCIRLLNKIAVPDEDLFTHTATNSVIASSLTMVCHCLSFLESKVKAQSELGSITFQLSAQVGLCVKGELCGIEKHVTLYNQQCAPPVRSDRIQGAIGLQLDDLVSPLPGLTSLVGVNHPVSFVSPRILPREPHDSITREGEIELGTMTNMGQERGGITPITFRLESDLGQTGNRSEENNSQEEHGRTQDLLQSLNRTIGTNLEMVQSEGTLPIGSYNIPDSIAYTCLSFLLDGSGSTTHIEDGRCGRFADLPAKAVVSVLKAVRDEEQNERGPSPKLIYKDLLSNEIKARQKFDIRDPSELNTNSSSKTITRVSLKEIKKPDRMGKVTAFATICAVLHSQGRTRSCFEFLKKYGKNGLRDDGCGRRRLFRKIKYNFHDPKACNVSKLTTSKFFFRVESDNVIFAEGTLDVFTRYLAGEKLHPNNILVRFNKVTEAVLRCPQSLKTTIETGKLQPVPWDRSLVARVKVFGEYTQVGTAILVYQKLPVPLQTRVEFQDPVVVDDVRRAVVISDLQLLQGVDSIQYPYYEWYFIRSLQTLREGHFSSKFPPTTISRNNSRDSYALLWLSDKIESN